MIACVIHGAKELKIENRPEPRPHDGEVLVRFGAGGICGSDLHYYHEGGILGPMLSGDFSLADAISAFELASDRSKAMKVSLVAGG